MEQKNERSFMDKSCDSEILQIEGSVCSMDVDEAIKEVSKEIGLVLKEKQSNAIKSFCQGNDTSISLPTEYGKSMIFALLPLVMDKIKGR